MMKSLSIALALLFSVTSAQATVMGGSLSKNKKAPSMISFLKPQPKVVVTPPAPVVVQKTQTQSSTTIPQQFIVFFNDESKKIFDDTAKCVDVPNSGEGSNVSAVPVPSALPLMATALGIFGITRRRKTLK